MANNARSSRDYDAEHREKLLKKPRKQPPNKGVPLSRILAMRTTSIHPNVKP